MQAHRLRFPLAGQAHLPRPGSLACLAPMLLAGAMLGVMAAPPAAAQKYPDNPIHLVVPFPPGGSTDLVARQYAKFLSDELDNVSVIVDNRPGASNNIGDEWVGKAKPDGYTLLFAQPNLVLNPIFGPRPSFDVVKALAPVSIIARVPYIVAAGPKAPFSNVKDFIAASKAKPGTYTISSAQLDYYVGLLQSKAQIKLLHVPYKGGAQAMTDTSAGTVDTIMALAPVLMPYVQGGRLKPIAVASDKRIELLPAVPTFAESGVDFDTTIWYGLLVPAQTPASIVKRLAQASHQVAIGSGFAQSLRALGVQPVGSTPAEFAAQMRAEAALGQKTAKENPGLVPDDMKK